MKKILLIIILFSTISCSKYVRFDASNAEYLENQNINIEKVQFYNANRVILWEKETNFVNKKKSGKIKTSTIFSTETTPVESKLPVIVKSDPSNPNILYVQPDSKSDNTLKFMKLSEASQEIREKFIKIYNLNQTPFKDELYYLIPTKIFTKFVNKEIYSDAGFWGNLIQPKRKNVYCGTIQWDGKEHQMYSKHATFLKISKKDRSKHITKTNKLKGNYIKD